MKTRFRVPIWILMAGVALVAVLVLVLKPYWPGWVNRYQNWRMSRVVLAKLERPVDLHYPSGIALGPFLETVARSTPGNELPEGIPIYVHPIDLQSSGLNMSSPIVIDVQGQALSTSLREVLHPHGLDYVVIDGNLQIVDRDRLPSQ